MLLTSSELLVLVVGSKLLMIESCKSKSEKAVWACFWLCLSPASVHPIEKKKGYFHLLNNLFFKFLKFPKKVMLNKSHKL